MRAIYALCLVTSCDDHDEQEIRKYASTLNNLMELLKFQNISKAVKPEVQNVIGKIKPVGHAKLGRNVNVNRNTITISLTRKKEEAKKEEAKKEEAKIEEAKERAPKAAKATEDDTKGDFENLEQKPGTIIVDPLKERGLMPKVNALQVVNVARHLLSLLYKVPASREAVVQNILGRDIQTVKDALEATLATRLGKNAPVDINDINFPQIEKYCGVFGCKVSCKKPGLCKLRRALL